MVCYNYRYMETVMELKSRIDAGEFGELAFISICGHGYTFHHSIDLLRYLCGEVTSVSAKFTIDGKPFLYPLGDWVYTAPFAKAAIFEFENGALGTVTGTDKLANDFPLMSLTYAGVDGPGCLSRPDRRHGPYRGRRLVVQQNLPLHPGGVCRCGAERQRTAITGVDGIRALELEDAILKSNNSARPSNLI